MQLETLRAQDEAALNELLEAQLPTGGRSVDGGRGAAIERADGALARSSATRSTRHSRARRARRSARMQDDLKKLHGKIIQAAKRKDETLRRQFQHAQAQAFPGGHPQEREIGFVRS